MGVERTEHTIGKVIDLPNGKRAIVKRKENCQDCALFGTEYCRTIKCTSYSRSDVKDIIYKEIKEESK